ncbi:MAG: hypothetical protein QG608_3592 [Actinomycetota bacterium]|nr:hypothetical protein [Actinomycetota bacterium]
MSATSPPAPSQDGSLTSPGDRRVPVPRTGTRAPTRLVTLYRLVEGLGLGEALSCLTPALLENPAARLDLVDRPELHAVLVHAPEERGLVPWKADALRLTGIDVPYQREDAGGLYFVEHDEHVYVFGFGTGHRWLADAVKDQRFGLGFAIRCLDPDQIHGLVRRSPGSRGRIDSTMVPGGAGIHHLGVDRHAEIVRQITGLAPNLPLTNGTARGRAAGGIRIEGGCGLRLRLGTSPQDLAANLRTITEVCRRPSPCPELAFVENIRPVTAGALIETLEERLDLALGPQPDGTVRLAPAICERALEDLPRAGAFRLRIGRANARIENDLDLEVFLRRTRLQPAGERVAALRSGTVEPLCDGTGPLSLGSHPALSWIEAVTVLDGRRYFLVEGHWYEFAIDYHEQVRAEVERILAAGAHDLDLPAWQPDMHEKDYNLHVAAVRPGYVCLDRKGVTTRLHRTHGVEICDLLGPDGELIHVKKAWGSAPLSHLFAQGMVSAQTLLHDSGARETFRKLVRETTGGRVDHDGTPRKVVFAVLLRDGSSLDAEDLFPFSQVTLCRTALALEGRVAVEILPIRRAGVPGHSPDPRQALIANRFRRSRIERLRDRTDQ